MFNTYEISDNWVDLKRYLDEGKCLLARRRGQWIELRKSGNGYFFDYDFIPGESIKYRVRDEAIVFLVPTKKTIKIGQKRVEKA